MRGTEAQPEFESSRPHVATYHHGLRDWTEVSVPPVGSGVADLLM